MKHHKAYLKKDPEEVSEDTTSAGACPIREVVEHVGHSTGEGQHDHEEGDQEHQDVLQGERYIKTLQYTEVQVFKCDSTKSID